MTPSLQSAPGQINRMGRLQVDPSLQPRDQNIEIQAPLPDYSSLKSGYQAAGTLIGSRGFRSVGSGNFTVR